MSIIVWKNMANLFWKHRKRTRNLLSKDFPTEEEFENLIVNNNELLGDIFIFSRQVRGGSKKGIPDIIGSDTDGNICIIEMKNVRVTSEIIPQVLEYAMWAEKNPAELENLWFKSREQPEDYKIDFEKFDTKILIIAPEIETSTAEATEKIGYDVELFEIKRWVEHNDEFFLVNKIDAPKKSKVSVVKGKGDFGKEDYEKHRNKTSVKKFMELSYQLEKITKKKKWALETKFNKNYCGFKYGHYLVFGLDWWGSKTFGLFVVLPKKLARKYQPSNVRISDVGKRKTWYDIDSKFSLEKFIPLFQKSYDFVKEKRG